MDPAAIAEGRLASSAERLKALREGVTGWLGRRHEADEHFGQYETQLNTLTEVLTNSVDAVGGTFPLPDEDLSTVYEKCRLADRRAVWVERVWRFFSLRFDQRDGDGQEAACVRAADEVVWSCWRPCFKTGPLDPRPPVPGPVPLPYLDAVHAPEAFPPGLVPADLAAVHADAPFVSKHLRTLPVPTLRVPAAAAAEPWLLALAAHETAHHLQSAAKLVARFREAVEGAVGQAGGDGEAVARWSGWSVEVFADLASVALLGPWALWPVAELEWRAPARMAEPRAAYPPGHVRLRLLERAARWLSLDTTPAWPAGLSGSAPADLPDLAFVDEVIEAAMAVGPGALEFAEWLGFRADDFEPGGEVDQWRAWFRSGPSPSTQASLRAPRAVTAGVVAAAADARHLAGEERDAVMNNIRREAFDRIISVRAKDRRAAAAPVVVAADVASLAEALANAGEEELDEVTSWPTVEDEPRDGNDQ